MRESGMRSRGMLANARAVALTLAFTTAWTSGAMRADEKINKKTRSDFSGTWMLDRVNSDMPRDPFTKETTKKRRPIFGPPRSGIGSGPIGGAGMGGPIMSDRADPEITARTRELGRIAAEPPERFTIAVENDAIVMRPEGGSTRRLQTNGAKSTERSDGGLNLERKTRWDDEELVTELKALGGGGEMKQVYRLEGELLILETRIDGDAAARTVKLRQVYARQK
jgi:hypothetical protein